MRIERLVYDENYNKIHDAIFPKDPNHVPAIYWKGYVDDEYVGFVSGYFHDSVTFYIQRIGIPDILRGTGKSEELANRVWEHFKKEGFNFLMGTVEVINVPTIIVALKTGFKIHGFRVDTSGKQYIEIIKEL